MAVYYSVRCPNCNNVVESGKDRQKQYGSPFRRCRYCGHTYVDKNYIEPGALSESKLYKKNSNWGAWILLPFSLFLLYGAFVASSALLGIMGLGLMLLCLISIISNLKYDPRKDSTLAKQITESRQRLSDPHYVIALSNAGCQVSRELLDWARRAVFENEMHKSHTPKAPVNQTQNQICEKERKRKEKSLSSEELASVLLELCINELIDVMRICSNHNIAYNEKNLVISTFVYFYVIWIYNFGDITGRQVDKVEEAYKQGFNAFNRKRYENEPFVQVVENEKVFQDRLKRVDERVRRSFYANNRVFVDDGISDEFILHFVATIEEKEIIKQEIVLKLLRDWAHKAYAVGELTLITD